MGWITQALYKYADFMTDDVQKPIIRTTNGVVGSARKVAYGYQETMDNFVADIMGEESGNDLSGWQRLGATPIVGIGAAFAPLTAILGLGGCGDYDNRFVEPSDTDNKVQALMDLCKCEQMYDCDSNQSCLDSYKVCLDSPIIAGPVCGHKLEACEAVISDDATDKVKQGEACQDAFDDCESMTISMTNAQKDLFKEIKGHEWVETDGEWCRSCCDDYMIYSIEMYPAPVAE